MEKDFKTLLSEALGFKNISPEKLAQIINIPKQYILALQNLEIDKLPAAPYVHAYLKRIAAALSLNAEELWELYKKELAHKTSGAFDKLPANRFKIPSLNKKVIAIGSAIILVLIYLLINVGPFSGTPLLDITDPQAPLMIVYEPAINLEGKINPGDKLTINGEEIASDKTGNFSFSFDLQPGLNTIEFRAKRFLGKETLLTKQVLYQPELIQELPAKK